MGRRRGLIGEIHHQMKLAEKERVRAEKQADREYRAALREEERARKAEEKANKQLARATAAERKQLEKEAKLAHVQSMEAKIASLNSELELTYGDIDGVLAATLDVDDFVDLHHLREDTLRSPLPRQDLLEPLPKPKLIQDPPRPKGTMPSKPTGLAGMFGKGKYKKEVESAKIDLRRKLGQWEKIVEANERQELEEDRQYQVLENQRLSELELCQREHQATCAAQAKEIDKIIAGLGYGTPEAVQDYVSLVLSNSVYPDAITVEHDFEFDVSAAELALRVYVSSPEKLPHVKAYKYTKSTDQITTTDLSQKARKDRYGSMIHQVALRTLHEIFEADRRGVIKTISLEVGTDTIEPATGQKKFILFVAAGAEREEFLSYNLSSVDPAATLTHIGASVSKNPFGLVATSSKGVRR